MKIRDMVLEDFKEVSKLMYQVHNLHLENRKDIYKESNPMTKNEFINILEDNHCISILSEENNEVLGLCMASIKEVSNHSLLKDRKVGFLDVLCVEESCRKRGIGKKLCDEIMFRLREKGAVSLELMVWSFNKEAINFYESIGMAEKNKVMEYKL